MNDELAAVKEILNQTQPEQVDIEDAIDETVVDQEEPAPEEELGQAPVENAEEPTDETPDAEGEEPGEIRTIAQLAEAIEVEPQYLYDIEIGMGEGQDPVKLGQLKDEYQAVVKERDAAVHMANQIKNQFSDLPNVDGMTPQVLEAQANIRALQMEMEQVNWEEAERQDPGQAALLKQKYQEAFQIAHGQLQAAQSAMGQARQARLQAAFPVMLEKIPAWQNSEIRKADQGKIMQMMASEGYHENEVRGITDPRTMKLLYDLMSLREQNGQLETAKAAALKKVKKAPKVIGSARRVAKNDKKRTEEAIQRAKNAPRTQRRGAELDAVKAILSSQASN
jgi:hypothetical protein